MLLKSIAKMKGESVQALLGKQNKTKNQQSQLPQKDRRGVNDALLGDECKECPKLCSAPLSCTSEDEAATHSKDLFFLPLEKQQQQQKHSYLLICKN